MVKRPENCSKKIWKTLNKKQKEFIREHEALHERARWNIAADFAIEQFLASYNIFAEDAERKLGSMFKPKTKSDMVKELAKKNNIPVVDLKVPEFIDGDYARLLGSLHELFLTRKVSIDNKR